VEEGGWKKETRRTTTYIPVTAELDSDFYLHMYYFPTWARGANKVSIGRVRRFCFFHPLGNGPTDDHSHSHPSLNTLGVSTPHYATPPES